MYLSDRYRRSYDSQFSASVVKYHVWPALVEGDIVLIKGEAVTKRAAVVQTYCVDFKRTNQKSQLTLVIF